MWVDCDDEHVIINTEVHRWKYRHMRRDPRVVVLIIDRDNPYSYAEVRGEVVEFVHGPAALEHADEALAAARERRAQARWALEEAEDAD